MTLRSKGLKFKCPLSVFKCGLHGPMSDQISWEQTSKYKKMFYVYEKDKYGKEDWEELNCKEKSEC